MAPTSLSLGSPPEEASKSPSEVMMLHCQVSTKAPTKNKHTVHFLLHWTQLVEEFVEEPLAAASCVNVLCAKGAQLSKLCPSAFH
jgi:hypothetical protein